MRLVRGGVRCCGTFRHIVRFANLSSLALGGLGNYSISLVPAQRVERITVSRH